PLVLMLGGMTPWSVTGLLLHALGVVACGLGIVLLVPAGLLAHGHLMAQLYQLYLKRGGKVIPLKDEEPQGALSPPADTPGADPAPGVGTAAARAAPRREPRPLKPAPAPRASPPRGSACNSRTDHPPRRTSCQRTTCRGVAQLQGAEPRGGGPLPAVCPAAGRH